MNFLIVALAVWRISSLLVNEEGPFGIFEKLRYLVGVRYDKHSEQVGTNVIAKIFLCVWCISIYLGALGAITLASSVLEWALNALALSTVAVIIEEVVNAKS